MPNSNRIFIIIIFGALLIGNAFFGINYFFNYQELQKIDYSAKKIETNQRVIDFTSMFIKEVLQADSEVDFETRLSLENAVRALKDEQVLSEWQNFTGSKTEKSAQDSVKKLLEILVNKIQK